MIYYWEAIKQFGNYGYPFVFLVSFIAGCSLPNPAPYIVIVFTMGTVLDPALVGATSGLGAGIGGTLVYLFGRSGSKLLPKLGLSPKPDQAPSPRVARFLNWAHRRGSIVVFVMSAMLNPIFAPMAIAMGALRFRLAKFFLMCWAGNTVKSLFIAYCGYLGLGTLLRWLGLSI